MAENQENNFSERLKEIRTHFKLTQGALAEKTGIKQSLISAIENNKRNISPGILMAMNKAFNINMDWLNSGKGEMLDGTNAKQLTGFANVEEDDTTNKFIDLDDGQKLMITPLVEEYAYAGYLSGYKDPEFIEELPKHSIIVNKYHKGNYQSFRAVGDSMTTTDKDLMKDNIYDGNIVTGREVRKEHWNYKLHTHKFSDYVVVHKDGILIKRIILHDTEQGILTLHSLNENKDLYPNFQVNLKDVYQIFNIVDVHQKR